MADISKLKLDNAVYNIKDSYAREMLAQISDPMIFKGTVGTNGTVVDLPNASTSTIGNVYKVITAGTYVGQTAKVGDLFICNDTLEWVLVPSGDDVSGTVTNVATGTGLTGGPITTSGTISVDFNSVQSKLVSGTDIKTINNQSLLGSGNIDIQAGGTVDTAMSDSSENAVQNKVIKAYVDSVILNITDDGNGVVTLSVSPSSLLNADTTGY